MREIEIDITSHHSKSFDDLSPSFIVKLDYVITLCAEEVCPAMVSKAKKLHWPLPDPAGGTVDEAVALVRFRAARDALYARIREFGEAEAILA
jgi:arsenate reductase